MTARWVTYVVFLLLIGGVAAYRIFSAPRKAVPEAVWLASVDLPANSRVETNHLQQPDFPSPIWSWGMLDRQELIGKYTSEFIPKGKPIAVKTMSVAPRLTNQTGMTLIYLPAKEFASMPVEVNAGAEVLVCPTDTNKQHGPFVVEAVFGKGDSTTLLIRVSNSVSGAVQSLTKRELRLAALPHQH